MFLSDPEELLWLLEFLLYWLDQKVPSGTMLQENPNELSGQPNPSENECSSVKCSLQHAGGGDCFLISGETGFEPGMDSIWIYLTHCSLLRKMELDLFFWKSSLRPESTCDVSMALSGQAFFMWRPDWWIALVEKLVMSGSMAVLGAFAPREDWWGGPMLGLVS